MTTPIYGETSEERAQRLQNDPNSTNPSPYYYPRGTGDIDAIHKSFFPDPASDTIFTGTAPCNVGCLEDELNYKA